MMQVDHKYYENLTKEKIDKIMTIHDHQRIDEFYWLNDRKNPEVIDYLNKENDYYNQETQHTKNFQEDLEESLKKLSWSKGDPFCMGIFVGNELEWPDKIGQIIQN